MSLIRLGLRFTAGRYHATPWGHHVNEGVPEWPPSPWRIVRALAAALHAGANGTTQQDRDVAWSAILKLAAPPEFVLPRASVGHTRHYMSLNQADRSKTALVIDGFVVVDRSARVVVRWSGELTAGERTALAALTPRVGYLGRAESWCEMELLPEAADDAVNCTVSDGTAAAEVETVRVLCPAPGVTAGDLERTTSELQREGWSDPPGSRWVFYRRPATALRPQPTRTIPARGSAQKPTVIDLAFGGTVLPRLLDAAPLGALVRRAVLAQYKAQGHTLHSFNLAGKTPDGTPLRNQHRHAHFVAEARRGGDRVTHVVVWAPEGFTPEEVAALGAVRLLNVKNMPSLAREDSRRRSDLDVLDDVRAAIGRADHRTLRVLVAAEGRDDDFKTASPLFRKARCWRSRTPFVLPRHPKRERASPAEQLAQELAARKFPPWVECSPVRGAALVAPDAGDELLTRWVEFDVSRGHTWPTTPVTGFRMRFAEPVWGPLLLGWGSHYGLGVFEPDAAAERLLDAGAA